MLNGMMTLRSLVAAAGFVLIVAMFGPLAACEFHQRQHVGFPGAQASTPRYFIHDPHIYDAIRMRPADLPHADGADDSKFTVSMPDGRFVSFAEITPAMCETLAATDPHCICQWSIEDRDEAARCWNWGAVRSAQLPVSKRKGPWPKYWSSRPPGTTSTCMCAFAA